MGLNIGWLIIWDRGFFGVSHSIDLRGVHSFVCLVGSAGDLPHVHHRSWPYDSDPYTPAAQSPRIYSIRTVTSASNPRMDLNGARLSSNVDIWLVRLLVHNGLAIYGTWLYIATLLNLTIWIARIYDRDAQVIVDASTAALSLVLVAIVIYFICENVIFYSSMAYTFLPWFVLIFALSGIMSKNNQRANVSDRNKAFVLALLIICCCLLVLRLTIFIVRYIKGKIPTFREP